MELARQQAQLNRLVIEEMADGVLVVDRELRVRAANPAARGLLSPQGMGPAAPFQLQGRAEWAALAPAVQRRWPRPTGPRPARDVVLNFGAGDTRTLRMRVRFTRRPAMQQASRDRGVLRAACSRTCAPCRRACARRSSPRWAASRPASRTRSATRWRPSRRPTRCCSKTRCADPQRRLARMVADNVERLKRIVDDVMEVAPGHGARQPASSMRPPQVAAAAANGRAPPASRSARAAVLQRRPAARSRCGVVFDAEHLRRVLVNLLDNAQRHAQRRSRARSACAWRRATRAARCCAWTATAPPIPPEVERYLFEPFFSTRSRGTGLGLYICRELCERYGASIEYRLRRRTAQRNVFLVVMRRETACRPAEARQPA